jgi:hypothetical protein
MRDAVLLLILLASPAFAHPPPGTNLSSAEHIWWECPKDNAGKSCCSEADGHVLGDDQWQTVEANGRMFYQVRIHTPGPQDKWDGPLTDWIDVPDQVVVAPKCGPEPDIKRRMTAKIWYYPMWNIGTTKMGIVIRCFIAGTMY